MRLQGGRWLCDQALEEPRHPPESWLFGRVSNTQVPVLDEGGSLRMVVKHDGQWPGPECRRAGADGLAGMLTRAGEGVWGSGVLSPLRTWPRRGELLVLHPGQGPAAARRYAFLGTFLLVVFGVFAGYYALAWSRQRETRIVSY